ncbi:unnamed protein product [Adineta steineri]|uniref:Uncharacterized protein n=1 Tax=Adineta steineri TaxID=433720 RepID=A0A818KZ42_9BILA|nr:unnamed protein product [Adineta steineri]
MVYRINKEKLEKYRLQYDKRNLYNEEKNKKIIYQKTISTQTPFNKRIDFSKDLVEQSINTLSTISKMTNDQQNDDETQPLNTISSSVESERNNHSSISASLSTSSSSSSSLKTTKKTIINNSNSSYTELDLYHQSNSEISIETNSNQRENYQLNDYSSKLKSRKCRIYIQHGKVIGGFVSICVSRRAQRALSNELVEFCMEHVSVRISR